MGRVWLKRADKNASEEADGRMVSDEEALGLKWKIV